MLKQSYERDSIKVTIPCDLRTKKGTQKGCDVSRDTQRMNKGQDSHRSSLALECAKLSLLSLLLSPTETRGEELVPGGG